MLVDIPYVREYIGKCPITHLRRAYKEQLRPKRELRVYIPNRTTYGFSIGE